MAQGIAKAANVHISPARPTMGEVLVRLPFYGRREGRVHPDVMEYAVVFAKMPEEKLAHALRKRSDEELGAMVRAMAVDLVTRFGTDDQKADIAERDYIQT